MPRRAAQTLILLTREQLVRADVSGKLTGIWQQPRPDVDDAGLLIEAALALGPKPGRVVWVLATDFWTQTISLAARTTASLSPEELTQAIAFEVEPLSGLSAFESVLAHREIEKQGGQQTFWIVQAKSFELEQIEETVHQAGSRLGGLGHPGGLPRPIGVAGNAAWQRVELWPDAVIFLHGEPGQPPLTRLINADPEQGRWQGDVDAWRQKLNAACPWETRLGNGEIAAFAADGTPLDGLDEGEALPLWLTLWAQELASRRPAVPLIRPAKRPLSASGQRLISLGLMGLALLGCGLHHWSLASQMPAMQAESEQSQNLIKQQSQLKSEQKKLQTEAAELKKTTDALEEKYRQCDTTLTAHRRRKAALMALLAKHRSEELVIQKIESDSKTLRILGLCLRPQAANQYADQLDREVRALSWYVPPPRLEGLLQLANGGPWKFEIRFEEIVPKKSTTPPPISNMEW